MARASTWDLLLNGAGEALPTVEVDTGDEYLVASACEHVIVTVLTVLGGRKRPPKVTVCTYEGPSVNFGRPTNSIFFAVAGPERVLTTVYASLNAVAGAKVRYGDYVPVDYCTPRVHLEDGVVWLHTDCDEWESVDASN